MADQSGKRAAEAILGQAKDAASLVDYGEGSVVSRIVMANKAGNVTLFALDAGQGISEHTTPYDALVQIIDGEAEIIISGKSIMMNTGDMLIMPANEPHALKAHKPYKMILTMIRA